MQFIKASRLLSNKTNKIFNKQSLNLRFLHLHEYQSAELLRKYFINILDMIYLFQMVL